MSDVSPLQSLIRRRLEARGSGPEPILDAWVSEIERRYGPSLLAVLLYGSYLRGERDSPPDFYVLVDRYTALSRWQAAAATLLPPNVYHLRLTIDGKTLRAKCTTVRLVRFESGARDDFHSYFWARFAQPSRLLYARDQAVGERVAATVQAAVSTFAKRVAPLMGPYFSARELWTTGLAMTYRCEFRSETVGRAETLYHAEPEYFDAVTAALAREQPAILTASNEAGYAAEHAPKARRLAQFSWWLRRAQGRLLSFARLCKATLTFDDPLDYLLWKIERHSGVRVTPTERQRRYPLIFAWPLLWKVYRLGGFR